VFSLIFACAYIYIYSARVLGLFASRLTSLKNTNIYTKVLWPQDCALSRCVRKSWDVCTLLLVRHPCALTEVRAITMHTKPSPRLDTNSSPAYIHMYIYSWGLAQVYYTRGCACCLKSPPIMVGQTVFQGSSCKYLGTRKKIVLCSNSCNRCKFC
jgi:hypothetical protein